MSVFLGASNYSTGQTPKLLDPVNVIIFNKCTEINAQGLNWWKCDSLSIGELFTTLKNATGLNNDDSMHIIKVWEDSITNLKHVKYQQYYKGIPLENVIYVEHSLNGQVLLTNGFLCENMNKNAIPALSEEEALEYALAEAGENRIYAWMDSVEYYLQFDSMSEINTYFPHGELVWVSLGDSIIQENYKLAWKYRVWAVDSPEYNNYVYIDAINGNILKTSSLGVSYTGTFNHLYYGTKYIETKWLGGSRSRYYLEADNGEMNIKTKDGDFKKSWKTHKLPDDDDNNWNNNRWAATASHWGVQESWKYWQNKWKRHGIDNNYRPLKVFADLGEPDAYILYKPQGDGADGIYFGTLDLGYIGDIDICGHEYTHGVIKYSSNLETKNEAGALNESYADIFGLLTERYVLGYFNWTIGEQSTILRLRNLQNPKLSNPYDIEDSLPDSYPTYYKELDSWYSGHYDDGGVHHNLAVQNFCFFLLSNGGSQLGITVNGIGIDKAARIAHYALTNGLVTPHTTYPMNREAWVAAAKILYGDCSPEQKETCKAWAAVGIGSPCPCVAPPTPTCWQYIYRDNNENFINSKNEIKSINSNIFIFPNPANDKLNIDFSNLSFNQKNLINSIEIFELRGKKTLDVSTKIVDSITNIDISNFEKGIYILRIFIGNYSYNYKFTKL